MDIDLIEQLKRHSLLKGASDDVLAVIADCGEVQYLSPEEVLYEQGSEASDMALVLQGKLVVYLKTEEGDQTVGSISCGQSVGEMSILSSAPRSASVKAVRQTKLIRLTRQVTDSIFSKHPHLTLPFTREVIDRLRTSQQERSYTPPKVIALVGRRADVNAVSRRLRQSLMIFGQVEAINQGPLNDLKVTFKNSSEFAVWLDDKELEVDYLLLPIDVATDHWQTVCQDHVDLTLLIKDEADVSPCPKQARGLAFEGIVIHPREQTIYSNTSRLFAEARPLKIHHVSLCNSFAFDRLARRLAGQATSLVLGGGGARGLAHIGVIKALTELKIPIDCIGGTSMGAFVAALYVLSNDWKVMREMAWDCWVAPGFLKYITLPLVSLLDCRRIENKMNQLFSGKFIEDAAIGFYCTSSNLTRAKVAVHTSGELSTWVIASVSLPGIAPPQIHQGELFVDGAVLNSLPIGPSQDLAPGTIMASNVSLDVDLQVDKGLSRMPTGWQILRQKLSLNQRQRNLPGILDIIDRASMLSSIKQIHDHEASVDISIMPPVGHVDMFSMKSIDCLIQAGYQETVRVMKLDDSV